MPPYADSISSSSNHSSSTCCCLPKKSALRKFSSAAEGAEHRRRGELTLGWGEIQILEFPCIMGDNPAAEEGCPLTVDWKPQSKEVFQLDMYEYMRARKPHKRENELVIPGIQRDKYLLSLGYTLVELQLTGIEMENIRLSRKSNMKGRFDTFKEILHIRTMGMSSTPQSKLVTARSG